MTITTFWHTPRLSIKGTVGGGNESQIRVYRPESYCTVLYHTAWWKLGFRNIAYTLRHTDYILRTFECTFGRVFLTLKVILRPASFETLKLFYYSLFPTGQMALPHKNYEWATCFTNNSITESYICIYDFFYFKCFSNGNTRWPFPFGGIEGIRGCKEVKVGFV